MTRQGVDPTPENYATSWREVWHPQTVQVWGRIAEDKEDSRVIKWLHQPYRRAIPEANISEGTIYKSSVTGQIGNIGRIWHRMYPVVGLQNNPDNPEQLIPRRTRRYLELLTFFPSDYPDQQEEKFLDFLEYEQEMFKLLWGS
jgi:CRISPR-associated protein Cmr6